MVIEENLGTSCRRIVIKIGTFVISKKDGGIDNDYIEDLARQLFQFKEKEIILVTSGAIGKGMQELQLKEFPREITLRQACAAVGQTLLMNAYHVAFKKYGMKVGQILMTYDNFTNRTSYLNLRNTFETLLKQKIIPVVNENDCISLNEIGNTFGDNDRLSALVASKMNADLLIMLSSAKGLCEYVNGEEKIIPIVTEITSSLKMLAGKAGQFGTGGMKSKLESAEVVTRAGIPVIVTYGKGKDVVLNVFKGIYQGTLFLPGKKISIKKTWIRLTPAKGSLVVDEGAQHALLNGKNLLPAGVIQIKGNFLKGDVIDIESGSKVIAKAISDFSSIDVEHVKGKRSVEIGKRFGYVNIARRENLILL